MAAGRHELAWSTDATPWVILTVLTLTATGFTAAWLGGSVGAAVAGAGFDAPPFTIDSLAVLLTDGPGGVWPNAPASAVTAGVWIGLAAAAAAIVSVAMVAGRFLSGRHPGLAQAGDLRSLTGAAARRRALALRPVAMTTPRGMGPDDTGVLLGDLDGGRRAELRSSWEDTLLVVMGPRAGKSAAIAAQALLRAPGPVVLTSTKADVYAVTRRTRTERGTVWVFDPQAIAHVPRLLWWDILESARSIEGARRLASHLLTATIPDTAARRDFWAAAAHNTLSALFHAAARKNGTVVDVLAWLANPADREPVDVLHGSGLAALAEQVHGTIRGAVETREGIYETARQVAACLLDPAVQAWVTPDPRTSQFRPDTFVNSTDSVYLLSKHGDGAAGGVIAAAADAIMLAAVAAAERAGGRIDPPLVAVLDEAANIVRIADLPDLHSHLGSRGVVPVTILQSFRQGAGVWGPIGMDALWSASTIKILGAGIDDADFAARLSRLVGEHKVVEYTVSHGMYGYGTSRSRRREPILSAADIRAIPRGRALLLATGIRPATLRLRPWFSDSGAEALRGDAAAELAAITRRAGGYA